MVKLAARDDNGNAVPVHKLNSKVVRVHWDDCEAARVKSKHVKPKGKCKAFGLAVCNNNVKAARIPELDDQATSARWDDCEATRTEFEYAKPKSNRKRFPVKWNRSATKTVATVNLPRFLVVSFDLLTVEALVLPQARLVSWERLGAKIRPFDLPGCFALLQNQVLINRT